MWTVENAVMTTWVSVALGLLLLFLGRKLFWVFVGVFGFLAGVQIATRVAQGQPGLRRRACWSGWNGKSADHTFPARNP